MAKKIEQCPICGWNDEKAERLHELNEMTREFGGPEQTEHGRKMPAADRAERTQLELEYRKHTDTCGEPEMVKVAPTKTPWEEALAQAPDDDLLAEVKRRGLKLDEKKSKGKSDKKEDDASGDQPRTTVPVNEEGQNSVGTHPEGPRGVSSTGQAKAEDGGADTKADGQPEVKDTGISTPPQGAA